MVLLVKAKSQAAKEHTSLTQMIEQGLTLRLRPQKSSAGYAQCDSADTGRGVGAVRKAVRST